MTSNIQRTLSKRNNVHCGAVQQLFLYTVGVMQVIPERVTALREKLELSQEDLAKAVGVTQQAIQQVEKGKSRSPRFLLPLARELKTSHYYLVGESDSPAPPANYFLTTPTYNGSQGVGIEDGDNKAMRDVKFKLIQKIMAMSMEEAEAWDKLLPEHGGVAGETGPRRQEEAS